MTLFLVRTPCRKPYFVNKPRVCFAVGAFGVVVDV